MPLDNVIFPDAFRLANRNPLSLEPKEHANTIKDFQVALFESAQRAINRLTPQVIPAGSILMRNVGAEFGKTGYEARRIPPNASKKTNVRWSGCIEGTKIARGALYTSLDAKGLVSEARRYSRERMEREVPWQGSTTGKAKYTVFGPAEKDYKQMLVGRVYYAFKLLRDITVVDLTPSAAPTFYASIEGDKAYQKSKERLRVQAELWRIVLDPVDYTGSRPIGLSILAGANGMHIRVQTAQAEASDLTGDGANIVIGGADDEQISFLEPVGRLAAGISDGRLALIQADLDPAHASKKVVVPGSVLQTGNTDKH
jgi:hypothetical protein